MADNLRIAADEPSPSDDGLSTIDMGDNAAGNDYKPDTGGGNDDLFGGGGGDAGGGDAGGDLFGGGGGAGGLGGGGDANAAGAGGLNQPGNLSPEELFINNNLQTYETLTTDIKQIVLDEFFLDADSTDQAKKVHLDDQQIEDVVQHLLRKGWGLDVLMQLSFNSKNNLEDLISDIVDRINKNVSSKIQIMDTLDKIEGGHDMTQANTAFEIGKDGKVKAVSVAASTASAAKTLTASEKFQQAKQKLSTALISSKRSLKKAKDGINRIHGILRKRERLAMGMPGAAYNAEESAAPGGDAPPPAEESAGGEGSVGGDAGDMAALDKEMSGELSDTGSDIDSLAPAIQELTDTIKELKDSLNGVEPSDISHDDFSDAEGMISEGHGMEDEMYKTKDEADGLKPQIAAAFAKKAKGVRTASEGKTYETAAKPHEDTVPTVKETSSAGDPPANSGGEKAAAVATASVPPTEKSSTETSATETSSTEKKSFLDKFLVSKAAKENTMVDKKDISKVATAKDIAFAEQVIPAIEAGMMKSDAEFWDIPDAVVASWDNIGEPVNYLKSKGYEKIAESLVRRAHEAHKVVTAASVGDVRSAKWTEVYKPIEDTSKVMDPRAVESNLARGGDIDKGHKSTHGEFTTDSNHFPENFGEGKGTDGLAPSMGDKNLEGKHVKAETALSQETEFLVRRAMEIAGEEQFKNLIDNPIAVAMTKELMRLGLPQNEAIVSAFNVLREGHESAFKIALNRGFEYCKKSEQELLRKAKEVATYKIALFASDEVATASAPATEVKTASARNPVLRSGQSVSLSQEESDKIDSIFNSMKQY